MGFPSLELGGGATLRRLAAFRNGGEGATTVHYTLGFESVGWRSIFEGEYKQLAGNYRRLMWIGEVYLEEIKQLAGGDRR